jgi:hypothetical protein
VIIWIALAIYSYSAIRDEKTRRADLETVP